MNTIKKEEPALSPEHLALVKKAHVKGFLLTLVKGAGVAGSDAVAIFKEADRIAEEQNVALEKKAAVLGDMRSAILTSFGRQPA